LLSARKFASRSWKPFGLAGGIVGAKTIITRREGPTSGGWAAAVSAIGEGEKGGGLEEVERKAGADGIGGP
jgi:hypothetical protein